MNKDKLFILFFLFSLVLPFSYATTYSFNFTGESNEGFSRWSTVAADSTTATFIGDNFASATSDKAASYYKYLNLTPSLHKINISFDYVAGGTSYIFVGMVDLNTSATSIYHGLGTYIEEQAPDRVGFALNASIYSLISSVGSSGYRYSFVTYPNKTLETYRNGVLVSSYNMEVEYWDTPNLLIMVRRPNDKLDTIYIEINDTTPAPPAADNTTYFSITATSALNSSSITTFNATMNGTTFSTTNGTINTPFNNTIASTYNITVQANNYIRKQYSNYDISSNLAASLQPIFFNVNYYSGNISYNSTNNYVRTLVYYFNYTCDSASTSSLDRFINAVNNQSTPLICDNTTYTGQGSYKATFEGKYNISIYFNTSIGTKTYSPVINFISDLLAPSVSNLNITFARDFVIPSANVTMTCIDNVMPILEYNLTFNNGLLFLGNQTNGTIKTNTTLNIVNGKNNATASCKDLFNTTTETEQATILLRTLYIINEQLNIGFDQTNLSTVKVHLDDNRTSYDFKANNRNNITFVAEEAVKLRFELIYNDGTIILRYVDIGLLEDDIRVCANTEGITHYEQILTSTTVKPVILKSVLSDCLVAADYTRFAYQDTKILKAYTYNNLYYLYTFYDGIQTFLTSVDGSIATYINLDTLEYLAQGESLNLLQDIVTFSTISNTTLSIYYKTINKENAALNAVIYREDTDAIIFNSSSFVDPNEAEILLDYSMLNGTNETTLFKIIFTSTDADGETEEYTKYFNINGASGGGINSAVVFVICLLMIIFGLSFTSSQSSFGWFGILIMLINIALCSFAVTIWYITFMQVVNVIILIYLFIVMTGKNQASIGG